MPKIDNKLPTFRTVVFKENDYDTIKSTLSEYQVGFRPLILSLKSVHPELQYEILERMDQAFKELGVHPKVPYPLYVISDAIKTHRDFLLVETEEEIPKFFEKKQLSALSRELNLLQKNKILRDYIKAQPIFERNIFLKKRAKDHRIIKELCEEIAFYDTILAEALIRRLPEEQSEGEGDE